nr:lipase family protein [Lolliginicoccus lacisalsi]
MLGQGTRIAAYLDAGYAVAATDYEGLDGIPAPDGPDHPYLEPVTTAYNMIDAVRAARAINDELSDQWASIGVSQGGQAAWAALEAAPHYGDGLSFVGGVAIAPAADLTPITDGPPPWSLGPFQLGLLPYVLDGYRAVDPSLDFDDYLRGSLADGFGALDGCTSTTGFASALTILGSTPDEVGPFTEEAAADIRDWLERNALPLDPTDEPLLVLYGDRDTVIPAAWTEEAVQRACAEGMTVDARLIPGADHFSIGQTDVMIDWLDERFDGQPAASTC